MDNVTPGNNKSVGSQSQTPSKESILKEKLIEDGFTFLKIKNYKNILFKKVSFFDEANVQSVSHFYFMGIPFFKQVKLLSKFQ